MCKLDSTPVTHSLWICFINYQMNSCIPSSLFCKVLWKLFLLLYSLKSTGALLCSRKDDHLNQRLSCKQNLVGKRSSWVFFCCFWACMKLQDNVWSHENYGFKGTGGSDGHTHRQHRRQGEETVFAQYFSKVAWKKLPICPSFLETLQYTIALLTLNEVLRDSLLFVKLKDEVNGRSLQTLKASIETALGTEYQ